MGALGGEVSEAVALRSLVEAELSAPTAAAATPGFRALVAALAARPGVLAVLFYGARQRAPGDRGGPLDLYVLTERNNAYHGFGFAALANRLLPPNIYFEEVAEPHPLDAKVAVIRLTAFRQRMEPRSWDTTLWARFSQPASLVWVRDDGIRADVVDAVAGAIRAARWWAVRLAPADAKPLEAWRALYGRTYDAELRVEGAKRGGSLIEANPERYAQCYRLAGDGGDEPGADARRRANRAWLARRTLGKILNLARLIKAAFTYRGGLAYALAKVERHGGEPVALTPWQRRWPWLAAPGVVWRLWREGRLR